MINKKMQNKHKESVKSYFSSISNEYSSIYEMKYSNSVRSYIFFSRKKIVLDMFDQFGGRVLDVGCGPAVLTEELLGRGCEVWGIDISENMIENAKRRMREKGIRGKLHFRVGDIEKLDFPDNYFDFILCISVLEYLNDDSIALREIRRVLKNKGRVIFTVPNIASPFVLADKSILIVTKVSLKIYNKILSAIRKEVKISPRRLLFRDDITDKYYLPWRFNKQLLKNGFTIDKSFFHVYRLASLSAVVPSLSIYISKKLEILLKPPLRWMGINYIVKATKE